MHSIPLCRPTTGQCGLHRTNGAPCRRLPRQSVKAFQGFPAGAPRRWMQQMADADSLEQLQQLVDRYQAELQPEDVLQVLDALPRIKPSTPLGPRSGCRPLETDPLVQQLSGATRRHLPAVRQPLQAAAALAAAGCNDAPLLQQLLAQAVGQQPLQPVTSQQVMELLSALQSTSYRPSASVMSQLLQAAGLAPLSGSIAPADLANVLHGLTELGYQPDERWVRQVLSRLVQERPTNTPQAAATARAPATTLLQQPTRSTDKQHAATQEELEQQAQSCAYAIRALERMGHHKQAQLLRLRFAEWLQQQQLRQAAEQQERLQALRQTEAAEQQRRLAELREREQAEAQRQAALRAEQQRRQQQQQELLARREEAERQRMQQMAQLEQQQAAARDRQRVEKERQHAALLAQLQQCDSWSRLRTLVYGYGRVMDAGQCAVALQSAARLLAPVLSGQAVLSWRQSAEVRSLLSSLLGIARAQASSAGPDDTLRMLSALQALGPADVSLLRPLLLHAQEQIRQWSGGQVVQLLQLLTQARVGVSRAFVDAMLARCQADMDELSAQQVSVLVSAVAPLGQRAPPTLLLAALDRLRTLAAGGQTAAEDVADAVRAVARADPELVQSWWLQRLQAEEQQRQAQAQVAPSLASMDQALASVDRDAVASAMPASSETEMPVDLQPEDGATADAEADVLSAQPTALQLSDDHASEIEGDELWEKVVELGSVSPPLAELANPPGPSSPAAAHASSSEAPAAHATSLPIDDDKDANPNLPNESSPIIDAVKQSQAAAAAAAADSVSAPCPPPSSVLPSPQLLGLRAALAERSEALAYYQQLLQREVQLRELTAKLVQLQAAFEQARMDVESTRREQAAEAAADVLSQLPPLVRHFTQLVSEVEALPEAKDSRVHKAYLALYRQMQSVFKSLGVQDPE